MRQRAENRNPDKKSRSVSVRGWPDGLLAKLKTKAKARNPSISLAKEIILACEKHVAQP